MGYRRKPCLARLKLFLLRLDLPFVSRRQRGLSVAGGKLTERGEILKERILHFRLVQRRRQLGELLPRAGQRVQRRQAGLRLRVARVGAQTLL